jgi:hypothetical protein
MSKHRESFADHLWMEKAYSHISPFEATVVLVLMATVSVGALF